MGWLKRWIWYGVWKVAVVRLFESSKKPGEMKLVRSDIDDLLKDDKSLHDRVDIMGK